jgi:hypothetical protein
MPCVLCWCTRPFVYESCSFVPLCLMELPIIFHDVYSFVRTSALESFVFNRFTHHSLAPSSPGWMCFACLIRLSRSFSIVCTRSIQYVLFHTFMLAFTILYAMPVLLGLPYDFFSCRGRFCIGSPSSLSLSKCTLLDYLAFSHPLNAFNFNVSISSAYATVVCLLEIAAQVRPEFFWLVFTFSGPSCKLTLRGQLYITAIDLHAA